MDKRAHLPYGHISNCSKNILLTRSSQQILQVDDDLYGWAHLTSLGYSEHRQNSCGVCKTKFWPLICKYCVQEVGRGRSTITQNPVIAMRCPYLAPIQYTPSYLLECVHEQQTQNGRYTWYTCNMYNQAEDKLVWRITWWVACSNLKALQEQPLRVLTISLVSKSTNKGLV